MVRTARLVAIWVFTPMEGRFATPCMGCSKLPGSSDQRLVGGWFWCVEAAAEAHRMAMPEWYCHCERRSRSPSCEAMEEACESNGCAPRSVSSSRKRCGSWRIRGGALDKPSSSIATGTACSPWRRQQVCFAASPIGRRPSHRRRRPKLRTERRGSRRRAPRTGPPLTRRSPLSRSHRRNRRGW